MVTFEKLDPADVTSALSSLPVCYRDDYILDPIGKGYKKLLDWANIDMEQAEKSQRDEDQERHSLNAVMNARRALSCLADEYLRREGIAFCKNPPRDAKRITEVLVGRGIFSDRSASCLHRAIDARNAIEHKYLAIPFRDAQELVHLVQMTIEFTVSKSPPYRSPATYGGMAAGCGNGPNGIYATFEDWAGCRVVFVTFVNRPWLGIVEPSSKSDAIVRRAFFDEFEIGDYLNILRVLDDQQQFPEGGRYLSANLWRAQFEKANLLT